MLKRRVVLYVAFGDRCVNQAIFSILTLFNVYQGKPLNFKVIVLTDKVPAFSWLARHFPVETEPVTRERLNDWMGPDRFIMRIKINAILQTLGVPETILLYADTDTLFLKKIDQLFEQIESGFSILHTREWPLSHGRRIDPKLCPKDLDFKLDGGIQVSINDRMFMWNAGVIGVSSSQIRYVSAVLELNDLFYKINPSWYAEQLCFSAVLSNGGKLVDCRRYIFHYWHAKCDVDKNLSGLQDVREERVHTVMRWGERKKIMILIFALFKFYVLKPKDFLRARPLTYGLLFPFKAMLERVKNGSR